MRLPLAGTYFIETTSGEWINSDAKNPKFWECNNNNNTNDNVYGAVIMTQLLQEFTRFIYERRWT